MCSPTAALALQGAGAVNSAVGAYYSAGAQKSALNLRADLDENAAQMALVAGQRDEQRSRLGTAQVKGTQRAAMAANGVDLGSDTPNRILTSTDLVGEVDAQTIHSNALRSAWGYRVQGAQDRAAAGAISPASSALTSLLGSSGRVAESWYSFNKAAGGTAPAPPGDGLGQGDRRRLGVW